MTGNIYINGQLHQSNVTFAGQGYGPPGRPNHYPLVINNIPITHGQVQIKFQITSMTNGSAGTFVYGSKTVGKVNVKV